MQVFTTIFLAETLRANIDCVEKMDIENPDSLAEFKQTLRERIAMLEGRNWLEDGALGER